jgi:hypothetical protein
LSAPHRDRVKAIGKQIFASSQEACKFPIGQLESMMARKQESTIEELTDEEMRSAVRKS